MTTMDFQDQESLVGRLRDVGLGRYEAAVYLGLITDSTARVSEISKRTSVPQPKVYQALDSLVEKGFCSLGPDGVNRYRAVEPALALSEHIAGLKRSEATTRELVDDLADMRAKGLGRQLWAPPLEIVKGRRQVTATLTQELAAAQKSLRMLVAEPHLPEDLAEIVAALLRRDVTIQSVFQGAELDDSAVRLGADALLKFGADVRVRESLPSRTFLVDDHLALTLVGTTRGEKHMLLIVRDAGLVAQLVASFEAHWDGADALD